MDIETVWLTTLFKISFLHVTQEKESHPGLERHDGFLVNYPSKFHFEIISPLNMR